jgi:lipid-A-disaccharide synthase-like uncharacterized protein
MTAYPRLRLAGWILALGALLLCLGSALAAPGPPATAASNGSASVKVKLEGVDETVEVIRTPDGEHRFVLRSEEGPTELSPAEFARRVYAEQADRHWFLILLNVTSPIGIAWVAVGLLGQVLFTGRMVVQWLVSERNRRSIVPVSFWWMALGGASMLLIYFLWRKDIVGVLGQTTGWVIYVRNLYFIYRHRSDTEPAPPRPVAEADEPSPTSTAPAGAAQPAE